MFSTRLIVAIAVLVLLITGASYASTQATSENLDPSTYKDPNQLLAEIAKEVPEFGGAFISDNGTTLNIYLTGDEENRSKREKAQEAMEDKFGVESGLTLNVIKGGYTINQLSGWYDTIHTQDFWDVDGVYARDLNEGENRIQIFVSEQSHIQAVEAFLSKMGIPRAAVMISAEEPLRQMSHASAAFPMIESPSLGV